MSSSLPASSPDLLEQAFGHAPDGLLRRIHDAIGQHPLLSPLFADVARFHLREAEAAGSPIKKRKLDNNGGAVAAAAAASSTAAAATVLLDIADVSFSLPQRKKLHLRLSVQEPHGGHSELTSSFSLLAIDPKTGRVELAASLADYARVLCLPVPERPQRLFNYCFIPRPSSSSSSNPAPDSIVFTLPAPPLKNATLPAAAAWPRHIIPRPTSADNSLDDILAAISAASGSSSSSLSLDRPDASLFASAFAEVQRKNEKALYVRAHVGTKDGYLFFLSTGIFFGFKKPVRFIPLDRIESTSFVRPVSRTFGLAITYHADGQGDGDDDDEEIEFDQIDNAEHAAINAYIQKHGIQDGSFAEARKAKLVKKDKSGHQTRQNGGDGDGDGDADGRTELEKAEQQLQDEEDEMEEDYDPDADESDSGSDSDSEGEEEPANGGKNLVADELGSEAEAVSDEDEQEEEEEEEEGEGEEDEEATGNQGNPVTIAHHHHQPALVSPKRAANEPDPEDEDQL